MATLQTLPQEELDRRSGELEAALDATWRAVVAEGGDITAASSPTAWARRIGRALSLLVNTYLRAADQALDDVDAGRKTGVGLVSSEVVSRWADDAQDRLVDSLSRLDAEGDPPGHLRTVAQTEVHGAANAGTRTQLEEFVDAGLTTITCTWRSRHDDRVRAWHREADGQQIKIDEAFRVGDSWLLAPGIPMPGRPFDVGDLCNCRCRAEYTYDIISSTRTSDDDGEAPVSDLDETALIAASSWKPEAHPRGKDGKFIKKGFLQSLLASKTPMVGQVLNAVNDLDDAQWNNLKPEQKQYVKDSVNKLPKSSTSYEKAKKKLDSLEPSAPSEPAAKPIPAHKGAKPGSLAKVSTTLAWGKYDADTVILENAAGNQRITWNGKNYVAQSKTSTGDWVDGPTYTKKSFYDAHKGDAGWVVPGGTAATVAPTSAPPKKVTAPKGVASVPTPPAVPKETSKLPDGFDVSGNALPQPIIADMLSKVQATPTPVVIAQIDLSTTGTRIVKNADGNFESQILENGAWKFEPPMLSSSEVAHMLGAGSAWKVNGGLLPALKKPDGDPVDDWSTQLDNPFGEGDVVAIHETGLTRVVKAGDSGWGSTYDVETLDPGTGMWKKSPGETDLFDYYFIDGMFGKQHPGTWVAGKPTPTFATSVFSAPTPTPTPPISKPANDASGGTPLSYAWEDTISNWSGALKAAHVQKGDVLAFKGDGSKRIVYTGDDLGVKAYDVEKWNKSTGKWETENKGVAAGWFSAHEDVELAGDWLMAKPNGEPYPTKKPPASAMPPATATKLAQDLTKPDGTVDWASLDAEAGTGKFAPGTVLVTHDTPAGVNYRVIVADDGVTVQLQSQGLDGPWQNFVGGAAWSAESAAGKLFSVKANDWKINPKLSYSPDVDPDISTTPGKPLTGKDAKSIWQLAETKATGDVVAEGVSGSGQKLQIVVTPDGGLKAQVHTPSQGWLDFSAATSQSQTAHMLNTAGMKWTTPVGGVTGLPTTPATAGPVHVSTAAKAADAAASPMGAGGDIAGIPDAVKKDMKSVLKDDKIGYWSKPDKIWDSVQKIQQKYADPANPGNSQYTPLQVLKSLDSTLKTSEPSPFETKITKWAATPKGQAYIAKSAPSALGAPSAAPLSTPAPKKFPTVTSDVPSYDVAWSQGKPLTGKQVADLVKTGDHLDIVAVHVKGSVQHRVIRSTDDPDTGEPRFYVQRRDNATSGGWDVVKPAGTDNGIMKTGDELDKYFPGMKFRSVEGVKGATSGTAAVPAPSLKKGPSVPIHAGSDDVSHLTPDQKSAVYAKFKSHKNVYVSSPELSIFNGLKNTAQDNNLSVMQVLKVVDEVGAEKVGATNSQLFEKKITAWLGTKQGTIAAGSEALSEALARKVDYWPGTSDNGIMSFEESSKLTYKNVSIASANKFGTDVQKQGGLPSTQTGAMNKYTGGVYSAINSYLYGGTDTITPTNMATAKNVQKSMRASTEPMLLHRGVYFDGVANSTSHSDLESKVGQTWLSGGFFSTSVGSKAAFSSKPVALEIEAPPGTPMSWLEPHSKYPGEHEMLLAAGLRYRIVSVSKNSAGKSVVRLRVVPPTEEVTV